MFNKKLKQELKDLKEQLDYTNKRIGINDNLYYLGDNHIKRAISFLNGEEFEEPEIKLDNTSILKILKENKKQIDYLTKSDAHNLWLFDQMTTRIKELEENLRLVYEYLGVHKEVINDTFLAEDDCICDECYADKCEEEFLEDVKPKKTKNK